ncbi:MAG: HNH endonuclease signature motif containing protein, partial [Dermatophilaceae bacterium]
LRVAPAEIPGLMRWTVEIPDDTSQRLYAVVEELAQEYLAADAVAAGVHHGETDRGPAGADDRLGARWRGRSRRTVDAARVDALTDLALGNAQVSTVVHLVVPADTARPATLVARPTREAVAEAAAAGSPLPTGRLTDRSGPSGEYGRPDRVLVDLILGRANADTLASGALEQRHSLSLMSHLEVAGNPFITGGDGMHPDGDGMHPGGDGRDPGGDGRDHGGVAERVWFVDGLVEAPGTSGLLPAHVVAILADPDTAIRVTGGPVGCADGAPAQRRTYRPRKALAEKVRARDLHCRFPGCSVPAARCHLDHVLAYPVGETVEENLHALCPAHHGFKHHAGWTLTMTPGGICTWTAPTGRRHLTEPGRRRDVAA